MADAPSAEQSVSRIETLIATRHDRDGAGVRSVFVLAIIGRPERRCRAAGAR